MAETADQKAAREAAAEHDRLEERVVMAHPDLPATKERPVEMSRRQLEVVYAGSGWVEVQADGSPVVTPKAAAEHAAAESATPTKEARKAAAEQVRGGEGR